MLFFLTFLIPINLQCQLTSPYEDNVFSRYGLVDIVIRYLYLSIIDKIKPSDMVYSVFSSICETLAQTSHLSAMSTGSRNIYFTGSFINIRLARQIITTELEGRNLIRPEVYFLSLTLFSNCLMAFHNILNPIQYIEYNTKLT